MQAEFAPHSLGRTVHGMECPLGGLLNLRRLLRFPHNGEFILIFLDYFNDRGYLLGADNTKPM